METLFWSWWLCINFSLFLSVIFTCELSNRKRRSWVLYLSTVLEKKAESLVLEAISLHQETDRRKLHFVFVCIYIYLCFTEFKLNFLFSPLVFFYKSFNSWVICACPLEVCVTPEPAPLSFFISHSHRHKKNIIIIIIEAFLTKKHEKKNVLFSNGNSADNHLLFCSKLAFCFTW